MDGSGPTGAAQSRPLRRAPALLLAAALAAWGCSLTDLPPLRGPGEGGRPETARRARVAPPPAQDGYSGAAPLPAQESAVFAPLPAADARALAARLSPASQSLSSFAELAGPLRASLEHLARQPQNAPALSTPQGSLSWGQLRISAQELLGILPGLDADPGLLAERFVWYELAPGPLLTGYYAPEVEASLTRQPGFEQPLYAPPPDLAARPQAYARRKVDLDRALEGRGLELAWVRGPAEAFLLQTEGAGVLRLPDGTRRGVQFAGANGLEFRGLGQLLLEAGALPRERLNGRDMREWCAQNPERARQIMAGNRSYVFFRFSSSAGEGSLGKALTPMVSLATDPHLLPLGAVAVLAAPLPEPAAAPLRGLVLAQDTGADIRGLRLDLFLGSGERAERLESGLRAPADLHLLVSKAALRAKPSQRGQ